MSWMAGTGPVKDISAVGITRGLSEDWYSDTSSKKEIKKGNFWDIIDNPLYQVAAESSGINWAEWVEDAKGRVGTSADSGSTRVRAVVKPGKKPSKGIRRMREGQTSTYDIPGTPAEYEWMTRDEADERGLSYDDDGGGTLRWRNKDTGEIHIGIDVRSEGGKGNRYDDDKWEMLQDWGIHNEDVADDLDGMQRWLLDIVQINDHLPEIIREGPKGEHYGIEGDIWEHYGLDQEIEPPKEMDWDSYDKKMQLATPVMSEVGYSTPQGITPVDLHGD